MKQEIFLINTKYNVKISNKHQINNKPFADKEITGDTLVGIGEDETSKRFYITANTLSIDLSNFDFHTRSLTFFIDKVNRFKTLGLYADNIYIFPRFNRNASGAALINNIFLERTKATYLNITGDSFTPIRSLVLHLNNLDTCDLSYLKIKCFTIDNSEISYLKAISFEVDTIRFKHFNTGSKISKLNLDGISNGIKPVNLVLQDVDFTTLKIPFDKVNLIIDTAQSFEKRSILYQLAIKANLDLGLSEKAQVLDKEFQKLKMEHAGKTYVSWINEHWWDYGYNKGRVFKIAFWAFGIFFLTNCFIFNILIGVYLPKNIDAYNAVLQRKFGHRHFILKNLSKIPAVFIYTAVIFWGIKLDVKDLKLRNWFALIVIIIEYTFGVICLAYIANFIITK